MHYFGISGLPFRSLRNAIAGTGDCNFRERKGKEIRVPAGSKLGRFGKPNANGTECA
jgi:hypothetical protein